MWPDGVPVLLSHAEVRTSCMHRAVASREQAKDEVQMSWEERNQTQTWSATLCVSRSCNEPAARRTGGAQDAARRVCTIAVMQVDRNPQLSGYQHPFLSTPQAQSEGVRHEIPSHDTQSYSHSHASAHKDRQAKPSKGRKPDMGKQLTIFLGARWGLLGV